MINVCYRVNWLVILIFTIVDTFFYDVWDSLKKILIVSTNGLQHLTDELKLFATIKNHIYRHNAEHFWTNIANLVTTMQMSNQKYRYKESLVVYLFLTFLLHLK